jgi:hypothetical protein
LAYQLQWLRLVLHDLHACESLDDGDIRLARLSTQHLAHVRFCTPQPQEFS